MAFDIFKLKGSIFVDNEKANESLSKTDKKAESLGHKFVKGAKKVAKFGAVVGAVSLAGGIAVAKFSVAAAQAQEKADKRLEAIAKTVAKADDQQIQSLKNVAAATQAYTTFGDEVLIAGQSQLLSFGASTEQTEELTESMANLLAATKGTSATQEDAIGVANLMGKAFNGQAGALSKAGILLDENQAAVLKNGTAAEKTAALVSIMEQNYGGLAETLAQTTEGQLQQAKNTIGDIAEGLGKTLLPIMNKVLKWVVSKLPAVTKVVGSVSAFITDTVENISEVINGDLDFSNLFFRMSDWLAEGESGFAQFAGALLYDIGRVVEWFQNKLWPVLKDIFDWVRDHMPEIKAILKGVFDTIITVVKAAWKIFKTLFLPILVTIFKWLGDHMPEIQSVFETVFAVIQEVIEVAALIIQDLWDALSGVFDFIKNVFIGAGDLIRTAFDGITGFLGGIADKVNAVKDAVTGAIDKFKEWSGLNDDTEFRAPTGARATRNMVDVQGLAKGGETLTSGVVKVGERGPENLLLPKGAQVKPLDQSGGKQVVIQMSGATFVNEQSIGDLLDLMTDYLRGQGVMV